MTDFKPLKMQQLRKTSFELREKPKKSKRSRSELQAFSKHLCAHCFAAYTVAACLLQPNVCAQPVNISGKLYSCFAIDTSSRCRMLFCQERAVLSTVPSISSWTSCLTRQTCTLSSSWSKLMMLTPKMRQLSRLKLRMARLAVSAKLAKLLARMQNAKSPRLQHRCVATLCALTTFPLGRRACCVHVQCMLLHVLRWSIFAKLSGSVYKYDASVHDGSLAVTSCQRKACCDIMVTSSTHCLLFAHSGWFGAGCCVHCQTVT